MSRLKYCPELAKDVSPDRRIALNARFRRRRRYINVLFLAAAVTTLCAPTMFNVDTDNTSFFGLSGQSVEHILTGDQAAEIKRKVTVPLLAGYIGKTNSVMASDFTAADVTYTGSWAWVDDGIINGQKAFRIKFLTSGTFTPAKAIIIDVFLVGGGGGGGNANGVSGGIGGGGGGYAGTWSSITISAGTSYPVVIGAGGTAQTNGGSTSFNATYSKSGGIGGVQNDTYGKNGGSGGGAGSYTTSAGAGGSNGANGSASGTLTGGVGQGTTTYEFGDSSLTLYGGGGGGGAGANGGAGAGGAGGGAAGGATYNGGNSASANTGGGGGGAGRASSLLYGGSGGSGICVIRNHR